MMKLNDSENYKEKKEKDKSRKHAERKRKKLELEALQIPSTSPQTTIAINVITVIRRVSYVRIISNVILLENYKY